MVKILQRFAKNTRRTALKASFTALLAMAGTAQLWAAPGDVVFSETFDTQEAFDKWTIVDNNGGRTWELLSGKAAYMLDHQTGLPGDDWLISPQFALSADNVYTLQYSMKVMTKPESLRVLLGTSADPASFVTVLDDYTDVRADASGVKTVKMCVKASGTFRLAFYAYSAPNGHRVEVDDITITETSVKGVPAKVQGLALTRGDKGALSATLAFKAPDVTAAGDALASHMGIDVYRNDGAAPVCQYDDVAPGAELSWTDTAPLHGHNTYRVVTRNTLGTGETDTVSDYIGFDAPVAVTGLTARLNSQRGAIVSWTAPAASAHGGYLDLGHIKYVVRRDGTQLGDAVSETTFTDANPVDEGQKAVTYTVTPVADGMEGEAATSGQVVTGTPLKAPYNETFRNQTMATPWSLDADVRDFEWELRPDDEDGEYEEIVSPGNDNGMLCALSKTADYDAQSRFVSPLLDLSTLSNPVMTFWFYYGRSQWYDPDYEGAIDDNLKVQVSTDAGDWQDVEGATFYLNANSNGWTQCQVYLPAQAKGHFTRVGLLATAMSEESAYRNIYIDDISIDEPTMDTDLSIESFSVDKMRVSIGEPVTLTATILNRGRQAVSQYSVELQKGYDTYEAQQGEAIQPGERRLFRFSFTPTVADVNAKGQTWRMGVVCDDDENIHNNIAETITTTVRPSDVPAVTGLSATHHTSGNALRWTAAQDVPAVPYGEPVSVTDDFESYTPFAISGYGDWTVFDGDGANTLVSPRIPLRYEHQGEPMAFQVFNNVLSGTWVDENTDDAFLAHSGSQYLICPCADYPAENDDWLISPRLDGRAQTISFWAHSATYDLEWLSLWASSTDSHHDSFVKVSEGDHLAIGENWRQYSFDVPEGTRYFAIRCVRRSTLLFVDDITYNRYDGATDGATLLGYNIYRDGKKVNAEPVPDNAYTDAVADGAKHTYQVTAVYDKGESALSDKAVADTTDGIGRVDAEAARPAAVYNVAGQRLGAQGRGLNIVVGADGKARKVMGR